MTNDAEHLAVHRAALALLLAVLDGDCDQRTAELLHHPDDRHHACHVAHHLAHKFVGSIDERDHDEMAADLRAELLDLAGDA